MKKILSILACLFVLASCSSKSALKEPQEIYERIKESGMYIELTDMEDGVMGTILGDDSYNMTFVNSALEDDRIMILFIYDKQNEENSYTVMSDPKNVNNSRVSIGKCTIDASTEKEIGDSNECNETDISDAKVFIKEVLSHFEQSDISPEGLSDMCKWYIKEKGTS
ncbi:hypothetical protein [Dysgonomonas capnocytophagoides]|uniref:hypothetical protein n=1 Tax=Dysgonomonas capnocytophagoides TaxID=45254 RepID=UPI002A82DADE|nr:hypothetical protein [Dysgonomonas capnocytophagoides]